MSVSNSLRRAIHPFPIQCRQLARLTLTSLLVSAAVAQNPQAGLASFRLHPEFQIEQVASEPLVFDPVDLEFDERGRAFAIEMPGYPFAGRPGNIVLLEDSDRDGVFDKRTVFAGGFAIADAILPFRGGLLVASPPDLVFVKDEDGDDVADTREVVLTGFRVGNPQHNFNGLTHGIDNWIYGANGGNSGRVQWEGEAPSEPVSLLGNDYRFRVEERRFERIGRSSGGFGMAHDAWGRIFGTHNLEHISQIVFPGRYTEGLPIASTITLGAISDHSEGGLARIFPIGVQESRVNHPEQSGYFSGSCGITFYGGGAFPPAFNGNVFVADVVLNLIHRDVLRPEGGALRAARGRERVEFLASTDRAFRPVNMSTGPDGALYILDMHREIIEHPEWIPDELEEHMNLEAGKEAGRIYRVTPKGGLPPVTPAFGRSDLSGVVRHLGHPNKWWRDTAQRLLVEWQEGEVTPALIEVFESSRNPLARLHALWTLEGLHRLPDATLATALTDAEPRVRENAVLIAEERWDGSQPLLNILLALKDDPDGRVRLYAALALGTVTGSAAEKARDARIAIAKRDTGDPWTRKALATGAPEASRLMLESLLADHDWGKAEGAADLVRDLAQRTAAGDGADALRRVLDALTDPSKTGEGLAAAALDGLAAGWGRRADQTLPARMATSLAARLDKLGGRSPSVLRASWGLAKALALPPGASQRERFAQARARSMDGSTGTARRLEELALLAFDAFENRAPLLYALLDTRQPQELQSAAMGQLAEEGSVEVARRLVGMWRSLGPHTRVPAGNVLLYRRSHHDILLTALEDHTISVGEMNFHLERRRTLLRSRDAGIRSRAEALFTDAGVKTRKEALDAMRPALTMAGNIARGHEFFTEACAQCHRIGDEGYELGPNLTEIFRKSAETLLHDIVDPNAGVDARFVSYTIETKAGGLLNGIISDESDSAVTLSEALGVETTIARNDIAEMYTGGLSLMPEEMEAGLDPQTMADLLAFLMVPR